MVTEWEYNGCLNALEQVVKRTLPLVQIVVLLFLIVLIVNDIINKRNKLKKPIKHATLKKILFCIFFSLLLFLCGYYPGIIVIVIAGIVYLFTKITDKQLKKSLLIKFLWCLLVFFGPWIINIIYSLITKVSQPSYDDGIMYSSSSLLLLYGKTYIIIYGVVFMIICMIPIIYYSKKKLIAALISMLALGSICFFQLSSCFA